MKLECSGTFWHTQPGEGKYIFEPSTNPKHPPLDCSTWVGPSTSQFQFWVMSNLLPSFLLSWPDFHVLGESEWCIKELVLILIRSPIIIHRQRDDIRVWSNLILLDEFFLSPGPSIFKVVQETTSVEWMQKVGKAVGFSLRSIFRILENKNNN